MVAAQVMNSFPKKMTTLENIPTMANCTKLVSRSLNDAQQASQKAFPRIAVMMYLQPKPYIDSI